MVLTPVVIFARMASIKAIAEEIGKTPVQVNEAAGFVVNRILIPMINEAIGIYADGVMVSMVLSQMRSCSYFE